MARKRKRRRLDPELVLAGRESCDVHELAGLIERVNPTGHGLDPSEERERYALKARLQSHLLRTFPDLVRVEETEPGVVSLTLAATGQHAAHCPIDALDDDVRTQVRFDLDTSRWSDATVAERGHGGGAPSGAGSLLAEGARALAEFDYALAEERFREAHAAAPEHAAAARALVEILVDSLGQDAAALEVGDALRGAVARDASIAGVLAVAAARSGPVERARELVSIARGSRAAESWALLARRALKTDDEALARAAREALEGLDPSHPELRALDEHIADLGRREREALESRLEERADAGEDEDDVLAEASRLLALHPSSKEARRVVEQIEGARRRARITELVRAAAAREARGDDEGAVARWREAVGHGLDDPDVLARLDAASERVERRRVRGAIERLGGSLRHDGPEEALVAWLDAPPDVREAVRASVDPEVEPLLAAADDVERHSRRKTKHLARAALALRRAEAALADGNAERALRLLDRQSRSLEDVPRARQLRVDASEREIAKQRDEARAQIEAAEAALAQGSIEEARDLLRRARGVDLDEELSRRSEALDARIARAVATELEERKVAARRRWAEVLRHVCVDVDESDPGSALPVSYAWDRTPFTDSVAVALDPDTLVVVSGAAGWLILRWVRVATSRVFRIATLRDPEADVNDRPMSAAPCRDELRVATARGVIYSLARDGSAVERCSRDTAYQLDENPPLLIAECDYYWRLGTTPEGEVVASVLDVRTREVRRVLRHTMALATLELDGAIRVLRVSSRGGTALDLSDARGVPIGGHVELDGQFAAAHPMGAGNSVLVAHGVSGEPVKVSWVDFGSGTVLRVRDLPTLWTGDVPILTLARTPEGFLVVSQREGASVLEAYADGADEPLFELPVHRLALQGVGERLIVFAGRDRTRVVATIDGMAAPDLAHDLEPAALEVPTRDARSVAPPTRPPDSDTSYAWAFGADVHSLMVRLHEVLRGDQSVRALTGFMAALVDRGMDAELGYMIDMAEEKLPESSSLRPWYAYRALGLGDWHRVAELVEDIEAPSGDIARWHDSLVGLLEYRAGRVDEAIRLWGDDGPIAPKLRERAKRIVGEHAGQRDLYDVVLDRVREADEHRRAGRLREAREVLDCDPVWRAGERASFARLASCSLAVEPRSPLEQLRRIEILAELVRREDGLVGLLDVIPIPEDHWDDMRIYEVVEQARAWLSEARLEPATD